MNRIAMVALVAGLAAAATSSPAQTSDLYITRDIRRAYENGTRSLDGRPGRGYWQNRADYDIGVRFDPLTGLLEGRETIEYFNYSPDTLSRLVLKVFPNYYKRGSVRDRAIHPDDTGEGVTIDAVAINGEDLNVTAAADRDRRAERVGAQSQSRGTGAGWHETDNGMHFIISRVVAPGERVTLEVAWHYGVNRGSHLRTGAVDSTTYFVAYFFPRIAVYDDIDGWDLTPYAGNAEFYNDFGDFQITVDVPRHYLVWATGLLQNVDDVVEPQYAARYKSAFESDTIVHVVDSEEMASRRITATSDRNSWRFAAENVNDVAFATSDHYLWDATSLVVDSTTGRRVLVEAAFNDTSADFHEVAEIARASIEIMSNDMPGVPYPYPNLTVFNGLDEMEYPMMVNDHSLEDPLSTISLTAHEIFHTYFPFFMGTNETKYAWMDEGWATYGTAVIANQLFLEWPSYIYGIEYYRLVAGSYLDVPLYAGSDFTKRPSYFLNSYPKSALFYYVLEDLLGEEMFENALHEYVRRWNGKHPTPYDFFFTFSDVCGQDLGWLYQPWFFEYGYPDLAIADVSREGDFYRVVIERVGRYPVPIDLRIAFADGSVSDQHAPVSVWRDGIRSWTLELPADKVIETIELGEPNIPDADPSNNWYTTDSR